MDCMQLDSHFVELHEDELEFLVDLAVNESQRWIEAVTRNKFRSPDFLESLEDGALLCELVERIWPRYIQLDDSGVGASFTRLYGQHTLEAFRGAAEKIGLEESVIFRHQHIHAPERYICSLDAQDAIQEALIRVTVTIYLLGWRAKETPTYPGPQLDLTAFTQLFQHYLRHLHNNLQTLANRDCVEPDNLLASPESEERPGPDSLDEVTTADSLDEPNLNADPDSPAGKEEEMPSQEMEAESEDTYSLGMRSQDGEVYRHARSGGAYYADSVGSSCDSACGSTSPSVADSHGRQRSTDGMAHDEFIKKDPTGASATSTGITALGNGNHRKSVESEAINKQKLKEDEIEWEANLMNWKSKRKSNLPTIDADTEEQSSSKGSAEKNLRTFPTMMADRLQRHGIPALYLDDNDNMHDTPLIEAEARRRIVATSDKAVISAQDSSEKDSSSGVSSPRSSRSLTSVSPPPSPTRQPQPEFETQQKQQDNAERIPARPEIVLTPTKKIISLTRLSSGDGCVNDWKVLGSPPTAEEDPAKNPNIETSIKPFGEKLAMFQKAQTDPTVLDMNKCNYKELAKPELSLKDKLSVFERSSLEASSGPDTKDPHQHSPTVVKSATRYTFPDPVLQHDPPTSSRFPETSGGGLSRLLTKDLQSNIRMTPPRPFVSTVESEANQLADVSFSERYMDEIEGIFRNPSGSVPLGLPAPPAEMVDDFPPPPLPVNPPPLPAVSDCDDVGTDTDRDITFPTPPPPLEDDAEEDSDNSQGSLRMTDNHQNQPFRRVDSTKRIKSELLRRRSDFFGLSDDQPDAPPAPASPPQKPRPISVHELSSSSPAVQSLKIPSPVDKSPTPVSKPAPSIPEIKIPISRDESEAIEREQKSLADSLDLEEEQWRLKDQRAIRTKESAIASIVEEYRRELIKEKEVASLVSKKEKQETEVKTLVPRKEQSAPQPGILKRSGLEKVSKPQSPKTVDIPVTVFDKTESRVVTKSEDGSKKVVVVETIEKVTEERRVNGRFETSSTEERRSVDHLTGEVKLPVYGQTSSIFSAPKSASPSNVASFDHKVASTQEQHYRDPSDGGYSSGRSDPGANVRSWLQHPSNNLLASDTRDFQVSVENCPPRPPIPTEFRPPVYSGSHSSSARLEPYQPQYTSKPVPLASSRMQPKMEPAKKSVSSADVQKHWLVQEAEMRRLTDAETRQRAAAVPPPLPNRTPLLPASQLYGQVAPMPVFSDTGYRSENSSLARSQPGGYTPVNTVDQYSSMRLMPQPRERFQEERYTPQQDEIRTVVRSIGPVHPNPHAPIVHRPNHLPSLQPAHRQSDVPKYPTAHNPVHLNAALQPTKQNFYQTAPLVSQSVPNVLQPPKSHMTQPITTGHYNRESAGNDSLNGVSAKWPCAHCHQFLGRDPAMIVENLKLVYHVACFKCVVCQQRLSDGREGADVRVRNGKLHCNSCLSDDGMQLSEL